MLQNRWTWQTLIPLLLLAFWLGARSLNTDLLWFDEAKTVLFVGAPPFEAKTLTQIWETFASQDPWQSPGYYLLLSVWAQFVGWSDFAARALSLLLGIWALAWLYQLGVCLFTRRIGFFAALVLVGSSLYIHYLHELRPYALYILMTCISIWAYWLLLKRPHWTSYLWLWIGLVGLAYTHPLALLTAFGIGFYHLLFAAKNRTWLMTSGTMALSALAFLPWALVIVQVIGLAEDDTRRQAVALFGLEIVDVVLRSFANGSIALTLLFSALALWDKRRAVLFLAVWLGLALGLAMALSYQVPAFIHVRYMLSVWVALALLTAVAIDKLAARNISPMLILGLWLIIGSVTAWDTRYFESLPNSRYNIPREGFMQMVNLLERYSRPEDKFILHSSPPFEEWDSDEIRAYYLHNVAADTRHMELIRPIAFEADEATYMQAVDDVLGTAPLVWTSILSEIPFTRRRDSFFQALTSRYTLCEQVLERDDLQLSLFARPIETIAASFGAAQVQAMPLWEIPKSSNGQVDLLLGLERSPELPPDTYSIGLHLYSEAGELAAQVDYGLPNAAFSCHWSRLTVPSGIYQLEMVVYAWRTLMPMVSDAGTERAVLGEIQVLSSP